MTSRILQPLAGLLSLAFILAACGQHPGVHVEDQFAGQQGGDSFAQGPGDDSMGDGMTDDGSFESFDEDGEAEVGDPAESGGEAAGGEGDGGQQQARQQEGGGQQQQQEGGGQQQQQQGRMEPQGSDRTGADDNTITIAVHAPVTGAAPLPSTSFERAGQVYWDWVTRGDGEVLGRENVRVMFADDKYEPSTARQVCRNLASRAFLVIGGGGTDQIQTCGALAGQARFPYFSAGVTEAGLEGNPWYFAGSMTYKQQTALLGQYVAKNFGGKKAAAIITQTQNFNDTVQGWEQAVQQNNIPYYRTLRHPKGDQSWYRTYARELNDQGVEVVFVLTSPLDYIAFAQAARKEEANFQYVGVGVSMGLNAVLRSGCPSVDGGIFFSPFPALETADKIDPDFRKASDQAGAPKDDIAWAIWGINKLQHEMFKKYGETFGNDLTREDFRAVVSNAGRVKSGVFPDVNYSPQNHFGGTAVHVLKADCSSEQYRDGGTFKSSF